MSFCMFFTVRGCDEALEATLMLSKLLKPSKKRSVRHFFLRVPRDARFTAMLASD